MIYLNNKLKMDLIFNLVSFDLIGLTGILFNLFIASCYSSNILGIFNQAYAVFLLLSQVFVLGVHLSVLRYIPEYDANRKESSLFFYQR